MLYKVIMTRYLIIAAFFFLYVFYGVSSHADIIWSGYSGVYGSLVSVLESADNKTAVVKTSLRECRDSERFILDGKITAAVLSKYVPAYLIAGAGRTVALYNMLSGRADWVWEGIFTGPVKEISQDTTGEFIAATDGASAALFRFGKKGLEHLLTKEFAGPVSAVLPDSDGKTLFTAERSGLITAWSFSGSLLGRVETGSPVKGMAADTKRNGVLIAAENGLYFMGSDTRALSKAASVPADAVYLDGLSGVLTVISGPSAYVYDYPSMRLIFSIKEGFGRIMGGGARFTGLFIKNRVRLFDIKSGIQTASVNITEQGSLFLPPETAIPGVDASLINMIAGRPHEETALDQAKVCAPVAAMVSGVSEPYSGFSPSVKTPGTSAPEWVEKPASPAVPRGLYIPDIPDLSEPFADNAGFSSGVKEPGEAAFPGGPEAPAVPYVKEAGSPELSGKMVPSSVPSWFAARKNLPPYNLVSSGADEDSAVKTAKKQIKDAAAREMIKKLVEGKKTAGIENMEVAKRFLWMAASSAASSLDGSVKTADRWVSPEGRYYVLCILDTALMESALETALKNETETLSSMSEAEYMARRPNVID